MTGHQLAQVNIARFRLPMEDPVNTDFVANLDRVNAEAEGSPGFVWRLVDDIRDSTDVQAFADPNVITNLSVWQDVEALAAFTYRNAAHLEIMRRRREWFDKIEFHLALWWVVAGHRPRLGEAKERLALLRRRGPSPDAFTFSVPFGPPGTATTVPILDRCA